MQGKNEEIFKGKTFSDLLKDIHTNAKQKERQINILIGELKPLIKTVADAGLIVPLIAEYMDISVKNDEHLVKMAAIVQRAIATTNKKIEEGDYSLVLSDEEKKLILDEVKQLKVESDTENQKFLETKKEKIIEKISDNSDNNDEEEEIKQVFK